MQPEIKNDFTLRKEELVLSHHEDAPLQQADINQHLLMSGGASSHYLNQSSMSGSEAPIYKEVSLKFSNRFGVTSDS